MLQYITSNTSRRTVPEQVKEVLSAGGNWIQVTTDGLTDDEIRAIVDKIMPDCLEKQSFLIFRDRVELAKQLNVGGVVVSQGSDSPSQARVTLGAAAVVGVEAWQPQQIEILKALDVDFIALRPFASLPGCEIAPIGVKGIAEICKDMESKEILFPRVATGGVTYDDIAPLMEAGCNGVAMSESIADAPDIAEATARAIALLSQYEKKEQNALGSNS